MPCTCYLKTYCVCPHKQGLLFPTSSHDGPRRSVLDYLNLIITMQKNKYKENFIAYIVNTKNNASKKYRCQMLDIWNILLIYTNKSDVSLLSPGHAFFYFFLSTPKSVMNVSCIFPMTKLLFE